jgi:hypothetical protein
MFTAVKNSVSCSPVCAFTSGEMLRLHKDTRLMVYVAITRSLNKAVPNWDTFQLRSPRHDVLASSPQTWTRISPTFHCPAEHGLLVRVAVGVGKLVWLAKEPVHFIASVLLTELISLKAIKTGSVPILPLTEVLVPPALATSSAHVFGPHEQGLPGSNLTDCPS